MPISENDNGASAALGLESLAKKTSPLKRALWSLALLSIVLMIVFIWLFTDKTEAPHYLTQPVTRGALTEIVTATGNLTPVKQVDVGTEVSGMVLQVEADYNDRVKVGQVLARLDTTRMEAQLRQSQSALESAAAKVQQAKASLREMQLQYQRLRRMFDTSGGQTPSRQDLDAATASLDRSTAELTAAIAGHKQIQATIEANKTDLSKAIIRSPIHGIVLKRSVEPGQTVAATLQAPVLFTIAEDLSRMELQVDINEADVSKVSPGQTAEFSVDAYPNRTFPAQITKVYYGPEIIDGVVTYKAVLRLDNQDLSLRPGMTATAFITVKQVEDSLLISNAALRFIPTSAVTPSQKDGSLFEQMFARPRRSHAERNQAQTRGAQQQVWTISEGRLVAVQVVTGASDGRTTEVVSGPLKEGMLLVTDVATDE